MADREHGLIRSSGGSAALPPELRSDGHNGPFLAHSRTMGCCTDGGPWPVDDHRALLPGPRLTTLHEQHATPDPTPTDKVVGRVRHRGRDVGEYFGIPASGRQVDYTSTYIWRLADGRVVEGWGDTDRLDLMHQLGAVVRLPDEA